MRELHVRRMEPDDVAETSVVAAASFEIDISTPAAAERFRERLAHLLRTDPDGAFVAVRGSRIVGAAETMVRERLWCLSLLAVAPGQQSAGAGRALFERALRYGDDGSAGLIVGSNDPRALRLYGRAGFSLRPTFEAAGPVDRSLLPAPHPRVRLDDRPDLEALERISREVRGAPYTPELELALRQGGQLLALDDRGFAVAQPPFGVWLLVARDDEAATALLWSALELAADAERPCLRWITGDQDWAIAVALAAGLRISATGALCVRGYPGPLRPFVPSGPFA
jgi:ribosomal protein S18 acetylase RimI-like enzyme